jgi:cold shock CspA family protein/ribosome-associated translation inhibitor RaiA
MQVPPEITYKNIEATKALDDLIQKQIARLEKVCNYIVSLRVIVEQEQGRHQLGNPYLVRLDIRVPPNHELVVTRQSVLHVDAKPKTEPSGEEDEEATAKHSTITSRKDEPLPAVIRRTFDSARRRLERLVELQRGEVKAHSENQVMAFVDKLNREDGFGFLRSLEGEQIYFHRNSTLHGEWERINVGTGVRYTSEMGEKGAQATSVEIVNKPGASEMHGELHDLPVLAALKPKKR